MSTDQKLMETIKKEAAMIKIREDRDIHDDFIRGEIKALVYMDMLWKW